jgi:hypothetical protein
LVEGVSCCHRILEKNSKELIIRKNNMKNSKAKHIMCIGGGFKGKKGFI